MPAHIQSDYGLMIYYSLKLPHQNKILNTSKLYTFGKQKQNTITKHNPWTERVVMTTTKYAITVR